MLEWPADDSEWQMPPRRFYADWTERDWGKITEQDYANLAKVQKGMKSSGCDGVWLNPRQEGNILHMHRVHRPLPRPDCGRDDVSSVKSRDRSSSVTARGRERTSASISSVR